MAAKEIFIDLVGFLMLLLFVIQAGLLYLSNELRYLWWFSNHAPLIIGLALIFRSSVWLTAEVAIGIIPEMIWITDFVYNALTGSFLTGVTSYLAQLQPVQYVVALQHLIVIPFALACLWILGSENGIMMAFSHGVVLWLSGYILSQELNINCSHMPCVPFLEHPAYVLFWPFAAILIIVMSNWILIVLSKDNPR